MLKKQSVFSHVTGSHHDDFRPITSEGTLTPLTYEGIILPSPLNAQNQLNFS